MTCWPLANSAESSNPAHSNRGLDVRDAPAEAQSRIPANPARARLRQRPPRPLSSAILHFLWQDLAGTPKPATRGRQFNDSGYQEQGVGPGVEPDRKTVRQGLDNEARRTGDRGRDSGDPDRLTPS